MKKRLLIDCTYVYSSGLNTGIQRVVRNIAKHSQNLPMNEEYEIKLVILKNNEILEIDSVPTITYTNEHSLKNYFKMIYKSGMIFLASVFSIKIIRHFLLNPKEVFGLSYLLNVPYKLIKGKKNDEGERKLNKISLHNNDVLILLDSTWHFDIWVTLEKVKKSGASIITVVYDLIPVSHPQYFEYITTVLFNNWISKIKKYSDGYLAISETVKNNLIDYLEEKDSYRFNSFMLGATFNNSRINEKMISEPLKKIFFDKKNNVYLIVSTIEIRKNHTFLLDVFDELWSKGIDVKLCIIGHIGWHVDELLERIKTHPELNKRLFMFNSIKDDSLLYAYKNSKVLLFPSIVEGFGLPIIESLQNGLPVLASNTPIHKEVGKDNIDYFELDFTTDLVSKIIKYQEEGIPKQYQVKNDFKWYDWQKASAEFITKVNVMSKEISKNR